MAITNLSNVVHYGKQNMEPHEDPRDSCIIYTKYWISINQCFCGSADTKCNMCMDMLEKL